MAAASAFFPKPMPIYEFYCPDNHRIYSFFARSLAYAGKTPLCPDNPKHKMEKMMSSFAVTGRAKEKPDMPPGADMDDPRMDAMMAQMEREMSTLDEKNPDPRQLAGLMRRMTELTGEKMPEEMTEMVRRLEAGEDPDKLESELGDVLGDDDMSEGGPGGMGMGGPMEGESKVRARLRQLRLQPRRGPVLYEMSEYMKKAPRGRK